MVRTKLLLITSLGAVVTRCDARRKPTAKQQCCCSVLHRREVHAECTARAGCSKETRGLLAEGRGAGSFPLKGRNKAKRSRPGSPGRTC